MAESGSGTAGGGAGGRPGGGGRTWLECMELVARAGKGQELERRVKGLVKGGLAKANAGWQAFYGMEDEGLLDVVAGRVDGQTQGPVEEAVHGVVQGVVQALVDAKVFKGRGCGAAKSIEWVAKNIGVKVGMKDAPSPEAWWMLEWVRKSEVNLNTFMGSIWPKLLPSKSELGDEAERMRDDGREVLETVRRMQGWK